MLSIFQSSHVTALTLNISSAQARKIAPGVQKVKSGRKTALNTFSQEVFFGASGGLGNRL
jgi:hypothetical protein